MNRAAWLLVACVLVGCGGSGAGKASSVEARDAAVDSGGALDDGAVGSDAPEEEGAPALGDAGIAGGDGGSVCHASGTTITCDHQATMLSDGTAMRQITYAVPLGTPPSGGWPAVVYFQGSFVPGHEAFQASTSDAFGMYQLTLTIAALLDRGYVVVAPDAQSNGSTYWQTNIPPYATSWSGCADDVLMRALLASLGKGTFGPVATSRLYAMGISSGGFMTSRMAVSYAGTFRALADHSGSYATCSDVCVVPTPLPANHPPTLFLHGDTDAVVPSSSIQPYLSDLQSEGFSTQLVTDPSAGHQWLSEAVTAIPDWFDAHP